MAKQPYTTAKQNHSNEFDEKKFIRYAENLQKELLVDAKQYLFDLQGYAKELKGPAANSIGLSVGFLESAIDCAKIGHVLDTQQNLSDAKYFYKGIPEDIISNVMKAARYGGQRNFVKYLHTNNS